MRLPLGLGKRLDGGGRLDELTLPVGDADLGGERGQHALILGRQRAAAKHQRLVVVDGGDRVALGRGLAGGSSPTVAIVCHWPAGARARRGVGCGAAPG